MDECALLEGLLQHYSPTGHEAKAVSYLVKQMQSQGFTTAIDKAGNAIGSLGSGPNEIVLLGHIDTVPGCIDVRRQGDVLWGRGAVDAKAPLACFVSAVARVNVSSDWKVTVIGAVGEEGDSHGAKFIIDRYSPKMVVIGEPSGWQRITLGYKGSTWLEYQVKKPVTHSASGKGTACETAIAFWNSLLQAAQTYNLERPKTFDQITPTLRDMSSTRDAFCEAARLKIGIRIPAEITLQGITAMCSQLAQGAEIKMLDGIPAYRSPKNTPLVRAFLAAIRKSAGQPGFVLKTGTSDMNLVAPVWNCPILAYGPGDSDLDHTQDEHVLLSEYRTSINILSDALYQVMQVSEN